MPVTTITNADKETHTSKMRTFFKLVRIAYQAAFYNKKKANTHAYVVFDVDFHDGCYVNYSGVSAGSVYTLYVLSHLLRDRFLRDVRNHEGSEATLENARTIINERNN